MEPAQISSLTVVRASHEITTYSQRLAQRRHMIYIFVERVSEGMNDASLGLLPMASLAGEPPWVGSHKPGTSTWAEACAVEPEEATASPFPVPWPPGTHPSGTWHSRAARKGTGEGRERALPSGLARGPAAGGGLRPVRQCSREGPLIQ